MEESNNKPSGKDKLVEVSLNGIAKYESGKIGKSDYFSFIQSNLDNYSHITFTPEQAAKLSTHMQKLSTGAYAMTPLFCAGPQCPFAARCPLQQMNKAPIGQACLIEVQLINHYVMRYMDEYEVDPNNFTEVGFCNELAEIEILEMRINQILARPENAIMTMDQLMGIDKEGNALYQKQLHPLMEQKEKFRTRRSKIVKLMVGDRQEKYKKEAALKIKESKDPSSKMAEMRKQMEKLQRGLDFMDTTPTEKTIKELENVLTPEAIIDSEAE